MLGFTPRGQSTGYPKDGSKNKWSNKWSPSNSKATIAQTSVLADSNNSIVNSSSLSNLSTNQC